jgi:glycosyltransferase involved in cell wall biosynthesis
MRIAILLDDLSGGGVERTMLTLADGFLKHGHAVDVVLGRRTGPLEGELPAGARVVVLDAQPGFMARLAIVRADPGGFSVLAGPVLFARQKRLGRMLPRLPSLVAYLRGDRPDVLVSAKFRPNLCAVWARDLASVPTRLVLTERTSPTEHFPTGQSHARHRVVPALMHRYYPRADQIVTVGRDLADDLARFASLPRERILAIHNPVVDKRIAAAAREQPDHPWLAPGEPPVVLGVGRIEPRKGFATLLRAFALVRAHRPARLVILGESKKAAAGMRHEQQLAGMACELGIAEQVSFPGFKQNPYAYMARAAAFVLASDYEGLPGALIQAMACGCPVVSTDCPTGPREILEDGRYGPLVPVGDHARMAEAIARMLDTPTPSAELRARAWQFSVDTAVEAYLTLFRDLGRSPSPVRTRYPGAACVPAIGRTVDSREA